MDQLDECPYVPVSWGELIDKITILRIKQARISDAEALENVAKELRLLDGLVADLLDEEPLALLVRRLQSVNEELWEIEDAIREHEAARDFGDRFVQLARSVYRKNDRRAAIKREINRRLGSALMEEKSYADWDANGTQPEMQVRSPALG